MTIKKKFNPDYNLMIHFNTMDKAQLDEIALYQGGLVGGVGISFYSGVPLPSPRFGYEFSWVYGSVGGRAKMVLRSTNDETYNILKEGKIRRWIDTYKLSREDASSLYEASHVEHGKEIRVIECVIKTHFFKGWAFYPGFNGNILKWINENSMPFIGMPPYVIDTAFKIINKWKGNIKNVKYNKDPNITKVERKIIIERDSNE